MATSAQTRLIQTLSQFEAFRTLKPSLLETLALGTRTVRASRGEIIVQRGDRPAGMYLILEGQVKLTLNSSAGAEKIMRIAERGDSFCEEGVFGDRPQALAAQAICPTVVLFLHRRPFRAAMAAEPSLLDSLIGKLSERVVELVEGIEQCMQRSSTQRVAHYLVQHADSSEGDVEIKLPCNKQMIASQLNLTPETFSRVLNRLTREGFILTRGRRSITLKDVRSLQSIAA